MRYDTARRTLKLAFVPKSQTFNTSSYFKKYWRWCFLPHPAVLPDASLKLRAAGNYADEAPEGLPVRRRNINKKEGERRTRIEENPPRQGSNRHHHHHRRLWWYLHYLSAHRWLRKSAEQPPSRRSQVRPRYSRSSPRTVTPHVPELASWDVVVFSSAGQGICTLFTVHKHTRALLRRQMAQVSRYWPVSNWGYFASGGPHQQKNRRTPPQTLLVVLLLLCLIICPAARARTSLRYSSLPVPSLMMVISLNSLAPFFPVRGLPNFLPKI